MEKWGAMGRERPLSATAHLSSIFNDGRCKDQALKLKICAYHLVLRCMIKPMPSSATYRLPTSPEPRLIEPFRTKASYTSPPPTPNLSLFLSGESFCLPVHLHGVLKDRSGKVLAMFRRCQLVIADEAEEVAGLSVDGPLAAPVLRRVDLEGIKGEELVN